MDQDVLNMQVRKFLKKVGITAQREIERAVGEAVEKGAVDGGTALPARAVVSVADIDLEVAIEGEIRLE